MQHQSQCEWFHLPAAAAEAQRILRQAIFYPGTVNAHSA
jgi:hypothetical protein